MIPYIGSEIIETLAKTPSPKRVSFLMHNTLTRTLPMSMESSVAALRSQRAVVMATTMQLLLRWFL
jgi:hypothetical protein